MSQDAVLDVAGLQIGAPIEKAAFDLAAQRLNESGLFASVGYRYGPGQNHGYVLTLQLADPTVFSDATIDVAGAKEDEIWQWVAARYPSLNRKVPDNGAAQQFLSKAIEGRLGSALEGHPIAAKLQVDLTTGKRSISFQPDPLPRIAAIKFTGQAELTAQELENLIPNGVKEQGYTDRGFRKDAELNLRRAYEARGMYRVRFPAITAEKEPGWSVSVTTSIEEGPKYTLGEVQVVGDQLPIKAMLNAAKFKKGAVADWTEIQNSIWEFEKPLKRMGDLDAAAKPERSFNDEQHILDLKLSINRGPLYRFGQLRITGLSPDLEARARKLWKMNTGDPFDYDYPRDFFPAFLRSVDSRQFKKYGVKMQNGTGERVKDFVLVFEPR